MQLKYAFSFAAVMAFLAACDSTVTNINDDAKAEGTITIKVVDNHSGAALSGVSVYSVVDDEAVIADSLGLSVWEDQLLGDHSFQISKDGYATVQVLVNLAEQGQGDVSFLFYRSCACDSRRKRRRRCPARRRCHSDCFHVQGGRSGQGHCSVYR